MKIFVANTAFFANNKGIEALTSVSINIIKKIYPNAEIVIWQTPPEGLDEIFSFIEKNEKTIVVKEKSTFSFLFNASINILYLFITKMFYLSPKNELFHHLSSADIVINLNYGDLFTDVYYGKKVWYLMFLSNLALVISKKPSIFFPQTIGPFDGFFNRFLAVKLLNESDIIMPREEYSNEILINNLNINSKKILLTPDIAFMLKPVSQKKVNEILYSENVSINRDNPIVGLILNPYFKENILKKIADLVLFIEQNLNGTVIIIPHTVSRNPVFDGGKYNLMVKKFLMTHNCSKVVAISKKHSARELKGLIGLCNAVVTFPTHASIFALSMGVPTIVITYSHKAKGIFKTFNLEKNVISFKDFINSQDLIRIKLLLRNLLDNEVEIKKKLIKKQLFNIQQISTNIKIAFDELLEK